jgi:8-oxo-dGTP pyrophosphatase MutT (NUDIX family)
MSNSEHQSLARPAATVVIAREHDQRLEILMLKRSNVGAFAGMWVFPGGRVDDDDAGDDELARARSAAIREAHEEVGLQVHAGDLIAVSHWTPPLITAKRFTTWFFLTSWKGDEVSIDRHEIVDSRWIDPAEALEVRLPMAPPTYVTMHTMAGCDSFAAASQAFTSRGIEKYVTVPVAHDGGLTLMWEGDAGYETADAFAPGARNRIRMIRDDVQHYERTI